MSRMAPEEIGCFRAAIEAAGLPPPAVIVADGKLHRFATAARPGDDAGWYVLHADPVPAGAFGDWRSGLSSTWRGGKSPWARRAFVPRTVPYQRVEDRSRIDAAMNLWQAASPARPA